MKVRVLSKNGVAVMELDTALEELKKGNAKMVLLGSKNNVTRVAKYSFADKSYYIVEYYKSTKNINGHIVKKNIKKEQIKNFLLK